MVTMNDIAARAGVSQTTVSFVLSGRENGVKISEETRRRVLSVAQELGYQRNELARAMVTGKSRVIGLLNYDTDQQEHIWAMLGGALDEAALHGYATKIVHLPFEGSREDVLEVIRSCRAWRLDALVSVALWPRELEVLTNEIDSTRCPVAYIENAPDDENAIRVCGDDESGMRAGLEHLVSLGHRRIAFLSGPPDHPVATARVQSFKTLMREMKLPLNAQSIAYSSWGEVKPMEQASIALLNSSRPPTAIFCAGDALAMIAMRVARECGRNVPADLSVLGFGNFLMAKFADPPLSSIRQPFSAMGQVAVKHILSLLEPNSETHLAAVVDTRQSLKSTLVSRQSTGPAA
jgi:LacI family transcriptional regulator